VPLPGYNPDLFPFYISKTMRSITLIDFKNLQAFTLVENKDMPVDCFAFKKMCLSTTNDGRIKILYVTSDKAMKNTVVEEIVLGR
jgi:hypothetical protein